MKKMKQLLMKSKLLLLPILMFFVLTVVPKITLAQTGFEMDNTDTGGVQVIDVPLDGGTIILIAAGVLFGAYKLYRNTQTKLNVTN